MKTFAVQVENKSLLLHSLITPPKPENLKEKTRIFFSFPYVVLCISPFCSIFFLISESNVLRKRR